MTIVPDLFFVECGNALARLVRSRVMDREQARDHLAFVYGLPVQVRSLTDLARHALETALDLQLTVYDACYAVLAQVEGAVLVTADGPLAAAVPGAELV